MLLALRSLYESSGGGPTPQALSAKSRATATSKLAFTSLALTASARSETRSFANDNLTGKVGLAGKTASVARAQGFPGFIAALAGRARSAARASAQFSSLLASAL